MFQISRRTDYAVRIMIELAALDEGERASARRLSEKTDVPKAFLHKLTADLVKAGLIYTYAGPKGGLTLAQKPSEINMLHIVEAMEGPVLLNACLLRPKECPRDLVCPGHGFWARLQISIKHQLQAGTLDRLAAEARVLQQKPRTREDIPYLYPDTSQID